MIFQSVVASNPNIDSLLYLLNGHQIPDSVKTRIYLQLAQISDANDFTSREAYALQSLKLAQKTEDAVKSLEILDVLINICNQSGEFEKATGYAKQAIQIAQIIENAGDVVYFSGLCGTASKNAGHYFEALEYYQNASDIAAENEWFYTQSSLINNAGTIYYYLGDELKALELFLHSLALKEKYDEEGDITGALINIGGIYNSLGDSEEGLTFLNRAYKNAIDKQDSYMQAKALVNIGDVEINSGLFDEAIAKYQHALLLADSIHDWQTKANILAKIGTTRDKMGLKELAFKYYLRSYNLSDSIDYEYGISVSAQKIGTSYLLSEQFEIAEKYFIKAAGYSRKIAASDNLLENYKALAELHKLSGNPEHALHYFTLYSNLKDSLTRAESNEKYSSVKVLYELDKKQNELDNLKLENEIVELQAQQSRYLLYGSLALTVILILVVILIFRQQKVHSLQKTIRLEQKLLRSQINPHFIFNALTAVQRFIIEKSTLVASDYLGTFSRLIRFILNSSTVDKVSISEEVNFLKNYLELQAIRFEKKFTYEILVDEEIDPSHVFIPPMLTQPVVENAVEHGVRHLDSGGVINVRYHQSGNHLEIVVEDNGVGREKSAEINSSRNKDHQSLASSITNERLLHLNKRFGENINLKYIDIKDEAGRPAGTKVILIVPVANTGE
ncbi:MAG: tetratricopeptide repeat protein [Bacteroidales bacterium]|nr:tetratricopeptide repeat protein [Bacteroidales bacterium]